MNNVIEEEVSKFNNLSEHWWNVDGEFKTLHDINPTRLAFIKSQTELFGKRVLDVGCGGGILTESLAQEGAMVTAIDLAEDSLKVAKAHAQDKGLTIDYQCSDLGEFSEKKHGYFDVVTCMELLEHVPDPALMIQQCKTVLRPGGIAFFSTLNRNLQTYLMAVVGAEYLLNIVPRGTHVYDKFIKPSELAAFCRDTNLDIIALKGLRYNPMLRFADLTDNVQMNYLVACRS